VKAQRPALGRLELLEFDAARRFGCDAVVAVDDCVFVEAVAQPPGLASGKRRIGRAKKTAVGIDEGG
jgi:hypothetical protein